MSMKVKVMAVSRKREGFIGILTNTAVYGQKWASAYENKETEGIKKGQTIEVRFEEKGEYLNFTMAEPIEAEDTTLEPINEPIEEAIDRRHGDRQSGAEMGNARTNATSVVIALYNKGDIKKEEIMPCLAGYIDFFVGNGSKAPIVTHEGETHVPQPDDSVIPSTFDDGSPLPEQP